CESALTLRAERYGRSAALSPGSVSRATQSARDDPSHGARARQSTNAKRQTGQRLWKATTARKSRHASRRDAASVRDGRSDDGSVRDSSRTSRKLTRVNSYQIAPEE